MAVDLSTYLSQQAPSTSTIDKTSGLDALASGQSNLEASYTTFLKLLTTQLKNQDPTSPLDTNNFTQQLTQMTGVQQQLLSNQLLKQLVSHADNSDVKDALGLLGKSATVAGTDTTLTGGKANWTYELDKTASAATLTVSDLSGKVLWTGPAPDLGAGQHAFTWDGKGTSTNGVDGQVYRLKVSAADAAGASVATRVLVDGAVASIRQSDKGAMVRIGSVEVPLTSVIAVKN